MADAIGPAKRSPTEFLKAVSDVTKSETGPCGCLGGVSGMARWLGSRTPRHRVPRSVAARWRHVLSKVLTRGAVPPQVEVPEVGAAARGPPGEPRDDRGAVAVARRRKEYASAGSRR